MKNNKRLCFFLPSFRTGGSEKTFVELSNFLVTNKNFDITFLCVNTSGKLGILLDKNITLINLNCNSVSSSIFSLIKYLKNKKPDLVISSMTHCNVILLLSKLISFSKTKIILRECSALDDLYPFDIRHPKNSLIRVMTSFLYNKADFIVSNHLRINLKQIENEINSCNNETIIPNWIKNNMIGTKITPRTAEALKFISNL